MPLSAPLLEPLSSLNHRHVTSSPSTNSELIAAVQDGTFCAHETHLLTADTQTAGRGQRGRSWQSPPGNVYLSLYHPMQMPVSGLLSLIIGVELATMPIIQSLNSQLQAQGFTPIGVKWANDLGFYPQTTHTAESGVSSHYEHSQAEQETINYFKKLAGILIEPVWRVGKLVGVVIGVGLNVQATPTLTAQTCEGMSYQALSLQDIYEQLNLPSKQTSTMCLPTLQELYQQMSTALLAAIKRFTQIAAEQSSAQTPYKNAFLRQFAAMDALAGLRLRVTQNHQGELQIIHGHACGIDTNGCLQLRQDNGKLAALFTGRIDVIHRA